MTRFARALAVAALLCVAALPVARAEVWGYVDDKGIAHFSSEQVDERYQLFFRGGESFDTAQGLKTPRPVAVPTAPPKLIAFFEVSPAYRQVKHHLREASKLHEVDYELLQAVIATESGFDVAAVSPKGAIGLMQIMPATAQRYGVNGDAKVTLAKKLTDPGTNVRTGTRYLRDLMAMFKGRLDLALAAYNAGEGAVQRAGNRIPNFPETQNYVKTVMQLYEVLKPPAMLQRTRAPGRIRMEMPGVAGPSAPAAPLGGAVGRGNLPPVSAPAAPSAAAPADGSLSAAPTAGEWPV